MLATHKKIVAALATIFIATNSHAAITPTGQITTSFGNTIDIYNTSTSSLIAIGFDAPATLLIDQGSNFEAKYLFIANRTNAIATFTLKDPSTTSNTTRGLQIGVSGHGQFNLQNGAYAKAGFVNVAVYNAGFISGIANIQDPNTHLNIPNGILDVGLYGHAILNISNGAKVSANSTDLATYEDSSAILNLQDNNSQWITAQTAFIARSGAATLNISNGAIAQSNNVETAVHTNAQAHINLQGQNTQWNVTSSFKLGINGKSTLNIHDQATLNIGQSLTINSQAIINIAPTSQNNTPINITQNATLNGRLNIITDNINTINPTQSFPLIGIGGTRSNIFPNYNEGDLVATINQYKFYLTYQGGDGNDIHLTTTQSTTQVLGDTNNDSLVNQADLDNTIKHFGTNSFKGDANHDNQTNLSDLFAVRNNFTTTTPIPEPTTLFTLLTLTPLLLTRKK